MNRKKGFVSLVFLLGFLNLFVLCSTALSQLKASLTIVERMKVVHREISWETALIHFVNCLLQNDEIPQGEYEIANTRVELTFELDRISVLRWEDQHHLWLMLDQEGKQIESLNLK